MNVSRDPFWWLPVAPREVQSVFQPLRDDSLTLGEWLAQYWESDTQPVMQRQAALAPFWYADMLHQLGCVVPFYDSEERLLKGEEVPIVQTLFQFLSVTEQRRTLERYCFIYNCKVEQTDPDAFCLLIDSILNVLTARYAAIMTADPPICLLNHYGGLIYDMMRYHETNRSSDLRPFIALVKRIWLNWGHLIRDEEHVIYHDVVFANFVKSHYERCLVQT
jgi:hypothetical protein